jgi:predicted metal-binding membrane protein
MISTEQSAAQERPTRPRLPSRKHTSSPLAGRVDRPALRGYIHRAMEAARLPRVHADPRQLTLVAALLVLALVGWLVTDERMAGMDAGPGTDPGALGFYVGVWVVMMAAMMFPSIAPMVVVYARIQRGRKKQGKARSGPVAVGLFVGGYLASWTAFGLAAYGLLQLGRALSIDALAWDAGGPYVAGGVLIAAAVYQLTPAKDVCLRKCRGPLDFVLGYWKPGNGGALRMGVEHGAWCVGCCWALMAALFALGVMSLGWMAFVAALIAIEKLLPWKAVANRGIAVLLAVLAVGVAFAPESVPGLTLPDSPQAREAMMQMGPAMDDHDGRLGDPMHRKVGGSDEEMRPSR